MCRDRVAAHPQNDGTFALQGGCCALEADGLAGAAWRVIFGVEVEDDPLAAVVAERHRFARVGGEREGGGAGAYLGGARGGGLLGLARALGLHDGMGV